MKLLKLLLLLTFVTQTCIAEIYKWVDENGVIHYSATKPDMIAVEEFKIKSYNHVVIEETIEDNNEIKYTSTDKKLQRSHPKKVIMYSAEWCGVCKKAKKYFKKENIRYTNYDIDKSKSARYRYKKLGAKGVPVIFVGKRRMNGFSIASFDKLYK